MLTERDRELRRGKITGSTAAACLGLSPYMTPMAAWLEITGRSRGEPTAAQRERWRRGHALEPMLIEFAAEEIATDLRRVVAVEKPGTIVHPSIAWAACTIDAVILARECTGAEPARVVDLDAFTVPELGAFEAFGVECKTVDEHAAAAWGRPWSDEIPHHVAIQCEWQSMHFPDATAIAVPAIFGGDLSRQMYAWRSVPDLRAALLDALDNWHRRHIVGDTPPPSRACDSSALAHAWTPAEHEHPDDPEIERLARLDTKARAAERRLGMLRDRYACEIKEILREATACRGEWGDVTWQPTMGRSTTDHAAAIERAAAMADAVVTSGGTISPAGLAVIMRTAIDDATRRTESRTLLTRWGRKPQRERSTR